jgi:methylmalonyl-CoA/ethylmalonyl-CoA epimerase
LDEAIIRRIPMKIDHIGIAVRSIEAAVEIWQEAFGYEPMTEVVENSRERVKVQFLKKSDSITIKLIEPLDEKSVVFSAIKNGGGCLHHLCFRCDNLEESLQFLRGKGCRILEEPRPGEAFENEDIAFVYAKMGLNVELIETDKKARLR